MSSRPVLFVATPCYGGNVHQVYMMSVLELLNFNSKENRFGLGVRLLGGDALVTRARNSLVTAFMDTPGATHILFIDADIGFEPTQVLRMLDFNEDVVAGMYPIKAVDWEHLERNHPNITEPLRTAGLSYVGMPLEKPERIERDGFVSAIYAGTGFMLIKRQVIDAMISAYPDSRYNTIHSRDWGTVGKSGSKSYALFDCCIDPDTGVYLSEDYTFCKRWTAIGGKIWLDTVGKLRHVGFGVFDGDPSTRFTDG